MNRRWLAAVLIFSLVSFAARAEQKKKKKAEQQKQEAAALQPHVPDEQMIDREISEMLGAWQVGQAESLHKYFAEEVTVVSGAYAPPIVGWANYLTAYQEQRKRLGSLRLDRRNTFIFVRGDVAWAAYQWEFSAEVDGRPLDAFGQTTLVLERSGDHWLIVHNHTSQICEAQAAPPPSTASPKPGA